MSPIKIWYAIVKRIRGYTGANDDTPVSAVQRNGRIQRISSKEMVVTLRAAIEAIGKDTFGFKSSEM